MTDAIAQAGADAELAADAGSGTDIRAVGRVAQILGLFSPTQPQLSATSVATRLNLNRTTAYRYCMSLAAAQILQRLDNGEFTPGPVLLQLGAFALGRRDVLTVAPHHMRALSTATAATAVLSLWGATGPVVSAVTDNTQRDIVVTVRVGTHLAMDTAQARIFYAYHPDQLYIERLLANLPHHEHQQLTTHIQHTRTHGYTTTTNTRGITILAAPVFDNAGLTAALALLSTRDVLSTDPHSTELHALRHSAQDITHELGGTLPGPARTRPTT